MVKYIRGLIQYKGDVISLVSLLQVILLDFMEALEKLFGSSARVKTLKFFLFNTGEIFEKNTISSRTKVSSSNLQKELNLLEKIGLIKKKNFFITKESRGGKLQKIKTKGYETVIEHKLFASLQNLLVKNSPMSSNALVQRLSRHGKLKLVIGAGVFIQDTDSRIDLLIVGDEIKENTLKNTIEVLESEIGKQLRYTVLTVQDFKYRLGVYDRLVRDILDYPHQIFLDKIGV